MLWKQPNRITSLLIWQIFSFHISL